MGPTLPQSEPAPLSLDDDRWSERRTRNGEATFVPAALRSLLAKPDDLALFNDLWPTLCSEGTTWSAAYAATPYILKLASTVGSSAIAEYLTVIGLIRSCEVDEADPSFVCPEYLRDAYEQSLKAALPLATEALSNCTDVDLAYLLASVAALRGNVQLAELLQNLENGCPHCGEYLLDADALEKPGT